jgi:hypothetical protein
MEGEHGLDLAAAIEEEIDDRETDDEGREQGELVGEEV